MKTGNFENSEKVESITEGKKPSGSCFWAHKWTRWEQYKIELIESIFNRVCGYETRQRKTCIRCGKLIDEKVF